MSTPTAQPARRPLATIAAAAAAVALLAGVSPAAAQAAGARALLGGTWGTAREVPGIAALNQGGHALTTSVSCTSPGDCAAGGSYTDSSGQSQAFVVSETNGSWGTAKEVPGSAVLNQGGYALITSVSCARAGSCAAGGWYTDSSGNQQAFVASETNGTWGSAEEVPGSAVLNQGGYAFTGSVSCAAGTCAAGGSYTDSTGSQQAFVVTQANGTWGTAQEVPGTAALNQGGNAGILGGYLFGGAVSCARAGSCAAGGWYTDGSGNQQAFVVTEANGRWGTAIEVPGTAALNQSGSASTNTVSCAAAGTCTAAGGYVDSSGSGQVFVASEVNGSWGTAQQIPGTAALNQGGNVQAVSVSCARAGTCAVGGFYKDGSGHYQAFVVSEAGGTWGTAEEIPGTAALNQGGHAFTNTVSCAPAGTCSAGGFYFDSSGHRQAFVVSETNGTWDTAEEVPGTAALNQGGNAEILSVSCPPAGTCAAGGIYKDSSGHYQAFVVRQT
jgi:cytochrome c551/c552